MLSDEVKKTVQSVIAMVLEDASFVFTDELAPEEKPVAAVWDAAGVSLTFKGPHKGVFRFWADRSFGVLLAANMLGVDIAGGKAFEKSNDALREMMNIIVGNAMTDLFGETAVFELGIPGDADPVLREADCANPDGIWLLAEEAKLLCIMILE